VSCHVAADVLAHVRHVLVAIAGVHADEDLVLRDAIADEVVDDGAARVAQRGVLRAAIGDAVQIVGDQTIDGADRVVADDAHLAHVRHVEEADVAANALVLGQDAVVLDRHVVAGELDHASAERDVRVVEGGASSCVGHGSRLSVALKAKRSASGTRQPNGPGALRRGTILCTE
jgi:hypothetical protein